MTTEYLVSAVVGLLIGAAVGLVLARRRGAASQDVERLRAEAEAEAARIRKEAEIGARESAVALTAEAEKDAARVRHELVRREERLHKKEEQVDAQAEELSRKESRINRREKELVRREKRVTKQEEDLEKTMAESRRKLERIAGLSQDQARGQLIDAVRDDARAASIEEIRAVEAEARRMADERARMIVSAAIQRYASEHVAERTVTVVQLPSEDLKGRIIGREGRNIRAFESATGCDLIVDETPDAVVISCFNPVRREVARLALEKLLTDGRIHPARIEEVVAKCEGEVDGILKKHGEAAVLELEVGGLHPELVKALGKLHFRQSFAQNVLRHSIEVGFLAGVMAAELGLNEQHARRAGLLHDIGKAVDHEVEGPHALVGANLARKHGEKKQVVQAIATHHEDDPGSVLGHLVAAANALSASRPGARRDTLAGYVRRLEDLEAIAAGFEGVEKVYAVQAGQEVRVLVDNARLSDKDSELLCRDIAKRVHDELGPQGKIRVTVLRETRAVQYAR